MLVGQCKGATEVRFYRPTLSCFARATVTSAGFGDCSGSQSVQVRFPLRLPCRAQPHAQHCLVAFLLILALHHQRTVGEYAVAIAQMRLTFNLGRPDDWQQHDSNNIPVRDMTAFDQGPTARLRQRSAPVRSCRTTTVTRVLHQREELPEETSLQWLVDEILTKNALHEGGKPSRASYGDEITEGQSSSSTLTLHLERKGSGEHLP